MWTQLLWKDWRVNRVVIAGSVILTACPYAIALLLESFYPHNNVYTAHAFRSSLAVAATAALVVAVLMAGVFGAAAFATERRERSAEFLAMLPLARRTVLLVKLLFTGTCVLVMWLLNVAALAALGAREDAGGGVHIFGPIILMAFGVGWLMSTFLTSPGIAAGVSIGVTVFTTWAVAALANEVAEEWYREQGWNIVEATVQVWTIGVGLFSLFVGSIYYLSRVEP